MHLYTKTEQRCLVLTLQEHDTLKKHLNRRLVWCWPTWAEFPLDESKDDNCEHREESANTSSDDVTERYLPGSWNKTERNAAEHQYYDRLFDFVRRRSIIIIIALWVVGFGNYVVCIIISRDVITLFA